MADELVAPAAETPAAPVVDVQQPESSAGTTVVPDAASKPESSPGGEQQPPAKDARLDVVLKALGRDPKSEAEAPPAEAKAEGQEQAQTETDGAAPQEGDDALLENDKVDPRLAAETQARIKGLVRVGKRYKAEIEPLKAQLQTLEPKAKNYDSIVTYARNAGMTQEFVGDLFHMGRLMQEDPVAFHEAFKDKWAEIETLVGARLPPDLQELVRAGKMAPEVAKDYALQRTKTKLAEDRLTRTTQATAAQQQADEQARQEREAKEYENAVGNSVTGWERQWKGTDPDFAHKQPQVRSRIAEKLLPYMVAGKVLPVAEILEMCNAAKKEVDAELRGILPKPRAINTPASGTTVAETRPAPGNKLQIAKAALSGMMG